MKNIIIEGKEYNVYSEKEATEGAKELIASVLEDELECIPEKAFKHYYDLFGSDILDENEVYSVYNDVYDEGDENPDFDDSLNTYEMFNLLSDYGYTEAEFCELIDRDYLIDLIFDMDGYNILDYGYGWEEKDGQIWFKVN